MKFILLIIIFNIALLEQYEAPIYIFDVIGYNEIEFSENELAMDDVDCLITETWYFIHKPKTYLKFNSNSYINISYKSLGQPIRAPPSIV